MGSSQPVIKTVTYATIAETIISHILDKRKFLTKLILEIRLYWKYAYPLYFRTIFRLSKSELLYTSVEI